MLPGTNAEYVKAYNRRIVLETVRRGGPMTRTEVAESTSLTLQTVSNIVQALAEQGLLVLGERRAGGRGQPPIELRLAPDGAFGIGLSLDRDHLTGVLVDLAGGVRARAHEELDEPPPEDALPRMERMVGGLLAELPDARAALRGIGVALPAQIQTSEDAVDIPTNFPGWEGVPVADQLRGRTGHPVFVDNDATAAAIGEAWYGRAAGHRDLLYVYYGLGLGGGLILDGRPYRGHGLNAGKLGHMPVVPGGRVCSCGSRGCLERYASIEAASERVLGAGRILHPDELEARHREGEPGVLAWLDEAARTLTSALLALENVLDPGAVLFGGRLPTAVARDLLSRLEADLPRQRMRGKPEHPILRVSELGPHVAALGAATLPLYEALAPSHGLLLKRPPARAEEGAAM